MCLAGVCQSEAFQRGPPEQPVNTCLSPVEALVGVSLWPQPSLRCNDEDHRMAVAR
jgi:hypothetical protein